MAGIALMYVLAMVCSFFSAFSFINQGRKTQCEWCGEKEIKDCVIVRRDT
jgi:hypothetical protein